MTKEEAIHVINQVRDIITKSPSWMEEATRVVNEAAEIAIKALEAQEWIPMSEQYKNKQSNCKKMPLPEPYKEEKND